MSNLPMTTTPPAAAACGRKDPATGRPCPIVASRPPVTQKLIKRLDHLYGPRPCPAHAGPNDRALAEVLDATWNDAFFYGTAVGRGQGERVARSNEVIERARAVATGSFRERDDRGRQLVAVNGGSVGFTYHWNDPVGIGDLEIGDVVELPANKVNTQPHRAKVIGIGSDYTQHTAAVLRLVERPGAIAENSVRGVHR